MNNQYKIRTMSKAEVADIAVKWANEEGWNPGLNDADCFYTADPAGFFAGELNGEVIACISAVNYDEKFSFMGFYIVKPGYRGKGFGMELFKKALAYAGKRIVGGDGVLERIEDYKKLGFKPAYKNRRYRVFGTEKKELSAGLRSITEIDFEQLCAYDAEIFPAKRRAFLKCWIKQPNAAGYAFLDKNKLAGYGVVRPCFKGYKIGPLFADGAIAADRILNALLSSVPPGEEVFFDVPEINKPAVALAEKNKMKVVFETMRIYLNAMADVPLKKVFGATSFELG
ncbi:MAG: GNAT family N-acetyltransferase [Candidatus Omnitrophica bacterium]|nr:GNAT family N-acetyltransferase [Candidatus Omnitrophota bacterium]